MGKFKNDELELTCISLTDEIKRGNSMLNSKKITIFNSSVMPLKNTNNFLVASRGWYGNVRSWDGLNFIILSIFNHNYKKIDQKIVDIDTDLLKGQLLEFKEYKNRIIEHKNAISEGPEDPRLFYYQNEIYILINEIDEIDKDPRRRLMYVAKIDSNT